MIDYLIISTVVFISVSLMAGFSLKVARVSWVRFESMFTDTADRQLKGLFLFTNAKYVFAGFIGLLIGIPLIGYVLFKSIVPVIVLVVLLAFMPRLIFTQLRKRRKSSINKVLPDVLDQLAGSLISGATFVNAVQNMVDENDGAIKQEFSLFLRELRVGTKLEEALDNLGERVRSEDMDLVISAALIARDVGGNLAEIFTRLSGSLRKKQEMEGKISALTAQGVLQGWVVSMLPFGILFALHFIEPEAMEFLWNSILGWVFLALIILLELLGGFFISRIVRIDV